MSENFNNNGNNQGDGTPQNLYVKKYEQEQLAELEEGAPQLNTNIDREINKKAIAFIVMAGFGLVGLGAFAYQQLSDSKEAPVPERAQVVTVPDLPTPEPVSAVPLTDTANTTQQASASNEQQPTTIPIAEQAGLVNSTSEPPIQISQYPTQKSNVPMQGAMENDSGGEPFFVQDGEAAQTAQNTGVATANTVRYLYNKDKLLVQGTYLRCVLETKIISEIPGFTSCIITEPVYSASGKYVLLPKGSKVMGQYGPSNPTSGRLGVIWDRIITPDGVDVTLKSPGVDNLGAAGHVGKFKSHWPSRLGSALLISLISDAFKYAAAEYGPAGETVTTSSSTITNPYESETADTLKQLAINQLERNNARPNTVTINQGSLINIYTAQDIDFSSIIP